MPSDLELEQSLRHNVQVKLNQGIMPSVNSVREDVETKHGLDEGFFKGEEWKTRSKDIIQEAYDKHAAEKESDEKPSNSSIKRTSASSTSRPRKKSKLSQEQQDDSDEQSTSLSDLSTPSEYEIDEEKPKKKRADQASRRSASNIKDQQRKKEKSSDPESDKSLDDEEQAVPNKQSAADDNDDSSSGLSSPIDDPPPPPKAKKSSSKNGPSKSSKQSTSKSKTKATSDASPDAEEIKRLQGWLVKCGIRKVWGKELKPYETPKAKIAYLKRMLTDAGMTGRYSNEKAARIKEARELAADIEAVQEGNERWGLGDESDGDEDDGGGRRRSDTKGDATSAGTGRRLVRGAKNYDFLSSDGEETD